MCVFFFVFVFFAGVAGVVFENEVGVAVGGVVFGWRSDGGTVPWAGQRERGGAGQFPAGHAHLRTAGVGGRSTSDRLSGARSGVWSSSGRLWSSEKGR